MATEDASRPPPGGRDALQDEATRTRDASSHPELPVDEESVTAAESDTTTEQSTSSNGYTYGTAAGPPPLPPPPKPVDDDAHGMVSRRIDSVSP
ncbi:uncharacterized protein GLRG_05315 [Colletotrichum graminicola M1.001]|uniref:Uncharacterized protein n=1 Tax=Colletotrichum graminicola (strain M1.001 / M2 / FGSC 10212) TaxID=645133 RepID=E3QH09_COLGM|nr:uncharacterized protein GLRG_05315 [Colletotrichum graminicola M1.001]EFQ30171.1 hypothetical protein GLRG_05315 [Colletotrichum graminicola M1.001]